MKYPTEHFAAYQEALNPHSFDGESRRQRRNRKMGIFARTFKFGDSKSR
jgi:hypothetical protein